MTTHLHRPPRKPASTTGLQDVHTTSPRYGAQRPQGTRYDHGQHDAPAPLPAWLRERLHSSATYRCPELGRNPGIPAARFAAYTLPSRVGNRLHYPDGRVEEIKP